VDGHDPVDWSRVLRRLVCEEGLAERLGAAAAAHAAEFSWNAAAEATLRVYADAAVREAMSA
jgi:D-inositol-3-phosphate glycosyltransferase